MAVLYQCFVWSPGRENRLGKKDRYEKVYTRNAEVFADIANYLLYEGEKKIRPDDLRELDGEELLVEEKKVLQMGPMKPAKKEYQTC